MMSVTTESMCNLLVKFAEKKIVVRLTDRLDISIAVDLDAKPHTKQIRKYEHLRSEKRSSR